MENIIYAYTRKQAVEDGEQVDVSTTAAEAGIRFPVFLTRRVFDAYVTVPPNVTARTRPGGFGTSFRCSALPSKAAAATATASSIPFMSETTTAAHGW